MTLPRTAAGPAPRRSTFRDAARHEIRLVPPLTRKALRKVSDLGTLTLFSGRDLVVACWISCGATAAFVAGGIVLLTHR